jgi:ribA/ribD-fused uncharacterized protein
MSQPHISDFSGHYAFLSNFSPTSVYILIGTKWTRCPTVEHGFQASKTLVRHQRERIVSAASPGEAKRLGQHVSRVSYWDEVKIVVMLELLRQKFSHSQLRNRLLRTEDIPLIEGNHWHDNFWGVCVCGNDASSLGACDGSGHNWLGKLLMRVRRDIR